MELQRFFVDTLTKFENETTSEISVNDSFPVFGELEVETRFYNDEKTIILTTEFWSKKSFFEDSLLYIEFLRTLMKDSVEHGIFVFAPFSEDYYTEWHKLKNNPGTEKYHEFREIRKEGEEHLFVTHDLRGYENLMDCAAICNLVGFVFTDNHSFEKYASFSMFVGKLSMLHTTPYKDKLAIAVLPKERLYAPIVIPENQDEYMLIGGFTVHTEDYEQNLKKFWTANEKNLKKIEALVKDTSDSCFVFNYNKSAEKPRAAIKEELTSPFGNFQDVYVFHKGSYFKIPIRFEIINGTEILVITEFGEFIGLDNFKENVINQISDTALDNQLEKILNNSDTKDWIWDRLFEAAYSFDFDLNYLNKDSLEFLDDNLFLSECLSNSEQITFKAYDYFRVFHLIVFGIDDFYVVLELEDINDKSIFIELEPINEFHFNSLNDLKDFLFKKNKELHNSLNNVITNI